MYTGNRVVIYKLIVKVGNMCLIVATVSVALHDITATWDNELVNVWDAESNVHTAAQCTVTVHLRLTLKAFSLSEFVALHVQIAGLPVCTWNKPLSRAKSSGK